MAKDSPYFKFHVNQWITGDITSQTDALQGFFIRFCAYYWSQDCHVTYEKTLKKFKQGPLDKLVEVGIIKRYDGVLAVLFLDEQYEDRVSTSKKNSENGAKGGKSRSSKTQPEATASVGASTQVSQGEKRREEKNIGEGEKREIPSQSIFFRINDQVFLGKVSEWLKKNKWIDVESYAMANGSVNLTPVLDELDKQSVGYTFNDEPHIFNAFRTTWRNYVNKSVKQNHQQPTSPVATGYKIGQKPIGG